MLRMKEYLKGINRIMFIEHGPDREDLPSMQLKATNVELSKFVKDKRNISRTIKE